MWLNVISSATFITLLGSIIVAVFGHGQRRVFAGGFVICVVGYLGFVYLVPDEKYASMERIGTTTALRHMERIGTTTALRHLHLAISSEIPNPRRGYRRWGHGATVRVPLLDDFMQIGQLFWALLIGWLGGLLACYTHRQPIAEMKMKLPPNST
jgi:hypothetical protein